MITTNSCCKLKRSAIWSHSDTVSSTRIKCSYCFNCINCIYILGALHLHISVWFLWGFVFLLIIVSFNAAKGKLPTKSILGKIASKSASTLVKIEQLQLWENSKIHILLWKKVQFEDLNQIMRKSWKKLSDNKKPWRKLFLKKKDGVHWCLGLLIQWFKITSRYSFLSLLVFLIK